MSWLDQLMFGYRNIQVNGVSVTPETTLNFVTGATAVDNPGQQRTDVTIGAANGSISSSSIFSVTDAGLTVTATTGWVYIYSTAAFTADRTITLPLSTNLTSASAGMIVQISDDATTTNGSLANHNLIVAGNGNNVQVTYGNGTVTKASSVTFSLGGGASSAPLGPGGTIQMIFNGTYWKVQ